MLFAARYVVMKPAGGITASLPALVAKDFFGEPYVLGRITFVVMIRNVASTKLDEMSAVRVDFKNVSMWEWSQM
ncbi:unnamed protein product, partial [Cylicostephanus goldi]